MRIDTPEFKAANEASTKDPRFVVRILFDVDSIAITSHDDIEDAPGGTVILGALIEPNLVSQLIKPDEATSEIGSASFELQDVDGVFTAEINERLADGVGLRRKRVEFYLGYAGLPFELYRLSGTQEIASVEHDNGRYSISCLDIQRALRNDILQPKETTIRETVTATQTTIPLSNADAFELVFHGPSYSDAPDTAVGYIKIKKEVIRYTGKSGDDLTGCTRGVFGTTAEAYTVDAGAPADKRERVFEHIYLELPALKLAYALLTGVLYNDGETLPDHWHLGIDPDLVVTENFLDKPDLWDPTNEAEGLILRFLDPGKQDGKRFLEKEVYLAAGVFSPVDVQGRLGIRRMNRLLAASSTVMTISAANAVNASQLEHEMDSIHNSFAVQWSFDGETFRRETRFIDPDSFTVHGPAPVFELKFKGLTSARHTDAVIFGILDMVRERYAGPPITMSVDLLHSSNRIEIGDVVRVVFPHLKDFTSATGTLDRAMEVQRVRCNHRTGRLQVDLFASTSTAFTSSPSNTAGGSALNDGFYPATGTALSSAPGITIASNVLTAASQPLVGASDVRHPDAIYYHTGNLTINAGVVLNITGNVQLRIRGFLTINGEIRGIGGGHAGVTDVGQPLAEVADFKRRIFSQETIPGVGGYVGNSKGQDGWFYQVEAAGRITDPNKGLLASRPVAKALSLYSSAPNLLLVVPPSASDVTGLPVDLRGAGGPPGGRIASYAAIGSVSIPNPFTENQRGGPGAAGGAGLLVICRGAGMGANGKIDISGADSAATTSITTPNPSAATGFPGAGGGGGPGAMYVLLDGSGISLPDFGGKFISKSGQVPVQGELIQRRHSELIAEMISEPIGGNDVDDPAITQQDLSGACLRVQYIPGGEIATGDVDSRPPPPTGLSATGVELGVSVQVTIATFDQIDTVELYASLDDDRANAGLIGEGRQDTFRHQLAGSQTRYYWARTRGLPNAQGRRVASDFFPLSATAGLSATSMDGGSGADGESVEIQYSADGVSFHDTYVAGDVFLRQRIGPGGTYTAAIPFVGEDGAPGEPGDTGNYIDFIFKRSATTPATPTGNMPAGWSQTPPASDGNPLFISRAERQSGTNSVIGGWSTPMLLVEDGEPGIAGAQGPGQFTWVSVDTGITVTPDTITKTGGTSGFNAGANSLQSYRQGSFSSANALNTNKGAAFALSTNPATGDGYRWVLQSNGLARSFVDATGVGPAAASYTTTDNFSLVHDAVNVMWFKNGTLVHSVPLGPTVLFLDAVLDLVGAGLTNVRFGPSGSLGPQGPQGTAAKQIRLAASAQVFTFTSAGLPNPSVQTITFTATRSNIGSSPTFTTTPNGIPLSGSGDTRTLTVADFGGNQSVKVRVDAEGFFDEITVFRLLAGAPGAAGQAAVSGFLTNEAHTLAADPQGTVQNFAEASGLFKVFEGVADVSSSGNYAIGTSSGGITAQINTADNTPVAGQPRGFYRVTALASDAGSVTFSAGFGSTTIQKTFSVVKSRQGQPGDGSNLLRPGVWVIGTQGTQGTPATPVNGAHFQNNGQASESRIVLGGADAASPLGPFGVSEPLWRCTPSGDSGPDGGWDALVPIDHAKSYRFFVWVYFEKLTGQFYLGCSGGSTRDLVTGTPNNNPYFVAVNIPDIPGVIAKRWYGVAGVVHGSGFNGGSTGIAGIYDRETGINIMPGAEYANRSGFADQDHRCYHFSDPDPTNRQYMCRPRVDEINGNEPNLLQLLGLVSSSPYVARNGCRVAGTSFIKDGGTTGWNADVQSVQGYKTAHVQWKAGQTNANLMIGLNADPTLDTGFASLDAAWYAPVDGLARIYENGSEIAVMGTYTPSTEFAITVSGGVFRYFRDKVQVMTRTAPSAALFYLDSSFFSVGAIATGVRFGPGDILETIQAGDTTFGAFGDSQAFESTASGDTAAGQQLMMTIALPAKDRLYQVTIRAQAEFSNAGRIFLTLAGSSTSLKQVLTPKSATGNTIAMIEYTAIVPANTPITYEVRARNSVVFTVDTDDDGIPETEVTFFPVWFRPTAVVERRYA